MMDKTTESLSCLLEDRWSGLSATLGWASGELPKLVASLLVFSLDADFTLNSAWPLPLINLEYNDENRKTHYTVHTLFSPMHRLKNQKDTLINCNSGYQWNMYVLSQAAAQVGAVGSNSPTTHQHQARAQTHTHTWWLGELVQHAAQLPQCFGVCSS